MVNAKLKHKDPEEWKEKQKTKQNGNPRIYELTTQ